MGTTRGLAGAGHLDVSEPTLWGQRELEHLSRKGNEAQALDALLDLSVSGEDARGRPLVSALVETLSARAAQEYCAYALEDTKEMLSTHLEIASADDPLPLSARDRLVMETESATRDAIYRLLDHKQTLAGEGKAIPPFDERARFVLSQAEFYYRRDVFPRLAARMLHAQGVEGIVRITGTRWMPTQRLPESAELEKAIIDSLDQNQWGAPVLDSLSGSGKDAWREALGALGAH